MSDNKTGSMLFNVSGYVIQTIKVTDSSLTFDEVADLLKNGKAFTTLGYSEGRIGKIILFDDTLPAGYREIAEVVNQESHEEMSIQLDRITEDEEY